MGVRIFNCCIVLLAMLYVSYGNVDAAVIKRAEDSLGAPKQEPWQVRAARKADSDEDSDAAEFAAALQDDSAETDDDDDDDEEQDDNASIRRRRETPVAVDEQSVAEPAPPATAVKEPPALTESTNTAPAPTPIRNTSVLILIRDALKKVTTLPTEQVATNALQYFQLFEHFIQQTIKDVIDDDDDDDEEEAGVANAEATTLQPESTFTPEEEGVIAGGEEILKEPELVTKQPLIEKPIESQVEGALDHKPVESAAANVVGQTKPVPGGPTIEGEKVQKMSTISEKTASKKEPLSIQAPITVKEPSASIDEPATNSI